MSSIIDQKALLDLVLSLGGKKADGSWYALPHLCGGKLPGERIGGGGLKVNVRTGGVYCHYGCSKETARHAVYGSKGRTEIRFNTKPRSEPSSKQHDQERQERAEKIWSTAYAIPDDDRTAPRMWLGEKCGQHGLVPGGIRWQPHLGGEGMVGSIVAAIATPEAWRDAYPSLPEPMGVQRIAVNADGLQVKGHRLSKEHWGNKKSNGTIRGGALILGNATSRSTVRVAEGVADALAIHTRWQQQTWALCGTSGFANQDIARALAEFADVIIHADAGEAGEKASLTLRDLIVKAGGSACVFAPGRGEDPADALGEIGQPLDGEANEREGVRWEEHTVSTRGAEAKVRNAAWEHGDPEKCVFNRITIGNSNNPTVENAHFPWPPRPEEMKCEDPVQAKTNLPLGEDHFFKGDCGTCSGCVAWWDLCHRERFRLAGKGKAVMRFTFSTLEDAQDWCSRQRKRVKLPAVRILAPGNDSVGVVLTLVYTEALAEKHIQNTQRAMKTGGVVGTIEIRPIDVPEFAGMLPSAKTLREAVAPKGFNAVRWARVAKFKRTRDEGDDYMHGKTEMRDPTACGYIIEPTEIPPHYRARRRMTYPQRAVLNAADRMARPGLDIRSADFLHWCERIRDGEIDTAKDMEEVLEATGTEYGGSPNLILQCARWYVGQVPFMLAYGPVMEAMGMLPPYVAEALGASPRRCPVCGSRQCVC